MQFSPHTMNLHNDKLPDVRITYYCLGSQRAYDGVGLDVTAIECLQNFVENYVKRLLVRHRGG